MMGVVLGIYHLANGLAFTFAGGAIMWLAGQAIRKISKRKHARP
jgi:hypothetical protein